MSSYLGLQSLRARGLGFGHGVCGFGVGGLKGFDLRL